VIQALGITARKEMICPHYAANKVGAGMQWLETAEAAIVTQGEARE